MRNIDLLHYMPRIVLGAGGGSSGEQEDFPEGLVFVGLLKGEVKTTGKQKRNITSDVTLSALDSIPRCTLG